MSIALFALQRKAQSHSTSTGLTGWRFFHFVDDLFKLLHGPFRPTDSWLGTGTRLSSSSTSPSQASHRRLRRSPLRHGVAHRIVLAGMALCLNILHRISWSARHWRSMLAVGSLLCRRLDHLEIWASCRWMFFNKLFLQSACRCFFFFAFHYWLYRRFGWSLRFIGCSWTGYLTWQWLFSNGIFSGWINVFT